MDTIGQTRRSGTRTREMSRTSPFVNWTSALSPRSLISASVRYGVLTVSTAVMLASPLIFPGWGIGLAVLVWLVSLSVLHAEG